MAVVAAGKPADKTHASSQRWHYDCMDDKVRKVEGGESFSKFNASNWQVHMRIHVGSREIIQLLKWKMTNELQRHGVRHDEKPNRP